jgi:hypothetical protein
MQVESVSVEMQHERAQGTCVDGIVNGTRYHFWINPASLEHSAALFQHCKRQNGESSVRTLDSELERPARIVAAMLEIVRRDKLVNQARAKFVAQRAQQAAQAKAEEDARQRALRLQRAAPQLLKAAQVMSWNPTIRAWLEQNDPKALAQLQLAIAAAGGEILPAAEEQR